MAARPVVSAALIAFAIGCSQPPPPAPKPDAAAVKAAATAFWAKWAPADTAGNVAGMTALVSNDFAFDVTGAPPSRGRAAWTSLATNMVKTVKTTSFAVAPSADWADGDHFYEQGSYTENEIEKGKARTEYGRYLAVFDKDSTNNLQLARIMVIVDSTPALKMTKAPAKAAPAKAAPAKATAKAPAKKSGR